jgi:hypothetical protein
MIKLLPKCIPIAAKVRPKTTPNIKFSGNRLRCIFRNYFDDGLYWFGAWEIIVRQKKQKLWRLIYMTLTGDETTGEACSEVSEKSPRPIYNNSARKNSCRENGKFREDASAEFEKPGKIPDFRDDSSSKSGKIPDLFTGPQLKNLDIKVFRWQGDLWFKIEVAGSILTRRIGEIQEVKDEN